MDRKKRVKRLKKLIIGTIVTLMVLPGILAVFFFVKYRTARNQYLKALDDINFYLENHSEMEFLESDVSDISEPEVQITNQYKDLTKEEIEKLQLSPEEVYAGYTKVYLTFDDGPSSNTAPILDILKEYDVPATFFVNRRDGRNYENLYRRIVNEGHALGLHSTSHIYSEVYKSEEDFKADTKELRDFLYMVTGVESDIYRFPGGSSNHVSKVDMHVFADCLEKEGIVFFDWNVSSQDASSIPQTKESIVRNVKKGLDGKSEAIILFHDLGSKDATVKALPEIIEYIQGMDNTVILPITTETNPIRHLSVE